MIFHDCNLDKTIFFVEHIECHDIRAQKIKVKKTIAAQLYTEERIPFLRTEGVLHRKRRRALLFTCKEFLSR